MRRYEKIKRKSFMYVCDKCYKKHFSCCLYEKKTPQPPHNNPVRNVEHFGFFFLSPEVDWHILNKLLSYRKRNEKKPQKNVMRI